MSILNGFGQDSSYAHRQVRQLTDALHFYEKINSDEWMYFTCDSCISPGQNSPLVFFLRTNLLLTGDLNKVDNSDSDTLDAELEKALKQFQRRHGLVDDGILGSETLEALNIPLSVRISQLRNNIDHWNKFSDSITEPFILINIPDFTLALVDSGKVTQTMKVILGTLVNPTPQLYSKIHSVVIHPSWVVPRSIATKEIVPMLRNDPDYLNRNHMKVYTFQKRKKIEINADTIIWKNISVVNFNYLFEQVPGNWNALGEVKFLFKNEHSVYLHDTPEKFLFSHAKRTYSHGCIRVEKPVELAAWLLNKKAIEVKMLIKGSAESKTILLAEPIPIFIEYFTSWVDDNGLLQFRRDIYNYDDTY